MNSVCNPIIYALRSSAFREGYRRVLCRQKPRPAIGPPTGKPTPSTQWVETGGGGGGGGVGGGGGEGGALKRDL